MKKKFVIEKGGVYLCEVLSAPVNTKEDVKLLRDPLKALKFLDSQEAQMYCLPGFSVSEYKPSYKELEEMINKLEEVLDTFTVHTNGISKYVRFPGYKARLLSDENNKDLVEDIQDLYNYQCTVEKTLQGMNK